MTTKRKPEHVPLMQGRMLASMKNAAFKKIVSDATYQFIEAGLAEGSRNGLLLFSETYSAFMNNIFDVLSSGESLFITEETAQLVHHASNQLPADDIYDLEAAKYPRAFIVFEEPTQLGFQYGQQNPDVRMSWVLMNSTMFDGVDIPVHLYFIGLTWADEPDIYATHSIGVIATGPNTKIDMPEFSELHSQGYTSFNPVPTFQALWALLNQPILVERAERPARPDVRKLRKKLGNGAAVRVVNIRRREYVGGTPRRSVARQYDHRWFVTGHWRMTPCGTGRIERRRTWIQPYIAGPDDKPLVVGDLVRKE